MLNFTQRALILVSVALLLTPLAHADFLSDCLLEHIRSSSPDTTVGELRTMCAQQVMKPPSNTKIDPGAVEERLALEKAIEKRPWVITPHKSNYILGYTYNSKLNTQPFTDIDSAEGLKKEELKFQISLKFPIWYGLFGGKADLYAAYTNQSWWQMYSSDISQPFREVNHEPEVFLRFSNDFEIFGLRNPVYDIGLVHQSNGRADPLSRSWNRLFANFVFERNDFAMSIKPWLILGESNDNPDIRDFMGYGDMRIAYRWKENVFGGLFRNNLKSDNNRTGAELTWSRPITDHLRLYAQYYYGYGESLLDYDARTNRIGVGIAINDYLR
jgi:phospholipase A1